MQVRSPLRAAVLVAGVVGGLVGAAYVGMLHVVQRGLWPDHWTLLPHGILLIAVGFAVVILIKLLGSPGDVEMLVDNIHVLGGSDNHRQLRSLIPVSLLCVGVGGGLGPEAPLVQTTGTLGTIVAERFHLEREDMRTLTITGMAAGFTVLFGAPLGSAMFALEILHRRGMQYYEALLPAAVGSLCGYAIYVTLTGVGLESVWSFPNPLPLRAIDLAWALGCGVAGAAIAIVFTFATANMRKVLVRTPTWARPALGGLGLALLAWLSPYALTFGEAQIGHVTTVELATGTLLLAVIAKLLASSLTVAAGWRGGFIIPLFFMGAALGVAVHNVAPSSNEFVLVSALMVAANVGVTKTPIGSVLVVTEMAGVTLLPTTLLASLVALGLTANVGMIHTQRNRGGT